MVGGQNCIINSDLVPSSYINEINTCSRIQEFIKDYQNSGLIETWRYNIDLNYTSMIEGNKIIN